MWRLRCPTHGVVTKGAPFAPQGTNLTRDLDDLITWQVTRMDKTAVCRLYWESWRTVGCVCRRMVATDLDAQRLSGLFRIGIDEISWRKHHKYLTLVVDQDRRRVVCGARSKDAATPNRFFDEVGTEHPAQIEAVSMDLGPALLKSFRNERHAPQAVVCADPFHLVKLVSEAFDDVRRELWQQLRGISDPQYAKSFKEARGALLKKPGTLSENPRIQLAALRGQGGALWRSYAMKKQFCEIFRRRPHAGRGCYVAGSLLLAGSSFTAGFLRHVCNHRDMTLKAIEYGISNGRLEEFNAKV